MAENTGLRGGVIGLGLVALLGIAGLFYLGAKPQLQPTPAAPPPPAATARLPEFDIVRVDPSGNAVIAGHGEPNAVVTIKDGDSVLGTVTADADGAFAFLPAAPLRHGAQALSLSETLPQGQVVAGAMVATVNVPEAPNTQALVVLSGTDASRLLSGQGPKPGTLGMGAVDYDTAGHAIFSGTAPAGAHVDLYIGQDKIGSAVTGSDGRWQFQAGTPKAAGSMEIIATTTAPGGAKAALPPVTVPFQPQTLPQALASGHVVIRPGQNLWLIARQVYGKGMMYTLIFKANASKIQNPNLIYPAQDFSLPASKG